MYQTGYYAAGYYATGYYSRPLANIFGVTYFSLIAEARQLLGDEGFNDCPVRYPDTHMINALNRGLQELGRIRPDAFYDTFTNNNLNITEVTDGVPSTGQVFWGALFGVNLIFYPALVYYVVGMTEVSEDEYVTGGMRNPYGSKAAGSLRMFRRHVLSV